VNSNERRHSPAGVHRRIFANGMVALAIGARALLAAPQPATAPATAPQTSTSGAAVNASAHAVRERGSPVITVYGQAEHQAGPQTFDITQDSHGILYFANLGGVATYDGAWWRMIQLPDDSASAAVAVDSSDRVATGDVREFGWLTADEHGSPRYQSLVPLLAPEYRDFGDLRDICAVGHQFFFLTEKFLFTWSDGAPRMVADYRHATSVPVDCVHIGSQVWLSGDAGLQTLDASNHPLPPVAAFAGRRVDVVLPGSDPGSLVVGVRDAGLFTYRDSVATPFAPAASAWLHGKRITHGARLPDGRIAVTTRADGIVIIRPDGSVDQVVDRTSGLPEDVLTACYADREGSLWLAYNGPIVRVDLASPVTTLDAQRGVKGSVNDLTRFRGKLYVGSGLGLFAVDPAAVDDLTGNSIGHLVAGVPDTIWALQAIGDDELLVATSKAIYRIDGHSAPSIVSGPGKVAAFDIQQSTSDPSRVWVGTRQGLASMHRTANGWSYDGVIPGTRSYLNTIVEHDGVVWCGTVYDGITRVDRAATSKPRVQTYGSGEMNAFIVGGRVVFVRATGEILQIDGAGRLVPDPLLGRIRAPKGFFLLAEDSHGNVWLNSVPPRVVHRRNDGTYDGDPQPLVTVNATDIQSLRSEADGAVLFGTDRGVFIYEPGSGATPHSEPAPLIRMVSSGDDRLIFGGAPGQIRSATLRHDFHRLRIEFAPASFRRGIVYQTRLDPIDSQWSRWSPEPFIDYTNLLDGQYTLRLRTRGPSGIVSRETTWQFSVLPPWYRKPWAILLWVLLAAAILLALIRYRTRTLERQAQHLRAKIEERTAALNNTVEQLREAQNDLEIKNELLEQLTLVDDLTGIANRRFLHRSLISEWDRAMRRKESLALILLDLDHFKELNDGRGHPAGDACLHQIAGYLAQRIRRSGEVVARYGGEEFAILLPDTREEEASAIAESLRHGIEALAVPYLPGRHDRSMTASFGVATIIPVAELSTEVLIQRADRAMYRAKHEGRNRVCLDSGEHVAQHV
jgi:diguanylate cyclase (GGDEF)-like protein